MKAHLAIHWAIESVPQQREQHACKFNISVVSIFMRPPSRSTPHSPSISIAVTITLVIKAKKQKTTWVLAPKRARITWRKVLAPGARVLSWTDSMEKSRIWMVAPEAYQKGPLIPYCKKKGRNSQASGPNFGPDTKRQQQVLGNSRRQCQCLAYRLSYQGDLREQGRCAQIHTFKRVKCM